MAAKVMKVKRVRVSVSSKLRNLHPWFEGLLKNLKSEAVKKRRNDEKNNGSLLHDDELKARLDEYEIIQQRINPDLVRMKEIREKVLVPHWGHTGVEVLEHPLGKTTFTLSFEIGMFQDALKDKTLTEGEWQKVAPRILQSEALFELVKSDIVRQMAVGNAAVINKLKIAITPPSSQTPQSGQAVTAVEDE